MEEVCFIILRHVCDDITNKFWNICCDRINSLYPQCLKVVIDDNSTQEPISLTNYNVGNNILIINSDFPPKRGEILPYYYFLKNRFRKYAIIIHDTVFFHNRVNFNKPQTYNSLWHFTGNDKRCAIIDKYFYALTSSIDTKIELNNIYEDPRGWYGSLGAMTLINHDFLKSTIVNNDWIDKLVNSIDSRNKRCTLERLISVLFRYFDKSTKKESIFGEIHNYFGGSYQQSFSDYEKKTSFLDVELVWVNRGSKNGRHWGQDPE